MPQGKDIVAGKAIAVQAMETTEVVKVHPHDTEERVDKGARLENQVKAQTPQNWRENFENTKKKLYANMAIVRMAICQPGKR